MNEESIVEAVLQWSWSHLVVS